MGMFQVRVKVSNPGEASRFFEEDFWVDTRFSPMAVGIGDCSARPY
jgi:hypothetical protein